MCCVAGYNAYQVKGGLQDAVNSSFVRAVVFDSVSMMYVTTWFTDIAVAFQVFQGQTLVYLCIITVFYFLPYNAGEASTF